MKRKIPAVLLTLLLLLSLAGCGGSSDSAYSGGGASMNQAAPAAAAAERGYWSSSSKEAPMDMMEMEAAEDYDDGAAVPDAGRPDLPEGVKMIYRANLELESTEFERAEADIKNLTAQLGGYFESQSMRNRSGGYRTAEYTVRVPAASFDAFLSQLGDLCTVRYQTQSAEDVSEYYYDMESRLETAKIKLDRLQELLQRAESMEDIITLESAISETEHTIESLSGEIRHYDALIGYSTIYITLSEVYRVTEVQTAPLTFGQRIARAFENGLENFVEGLEDLIEWLAYSWLSLLVFAAIVFGIVKLFRRRKNKSGGLFGRKRKKAEAVDNAAEAEDNKNE